MDGVLFSFRVQPHSFYSSSGCNLMDGVLSHERQGRSRYASAAVHQDTVVLDDGIEKRLSYDGRMQFVLDDAVERRLFIMAGCS